MISQNETTVLREKTIVLIQVITAICLRLMYHNKSYFVYLALAFFVSPHPTDRRFPMIKIASLMKIHDGYATEHSLDDNLGDGFLYSRNAFFSAMREWALEEGLRFSSETTPLWKQYQTLPFFSLQDIFDDRVVPYMDNVTVFRNVLKRDPGLALPLRFILDSLKKNYILHETSHYVAYRALDPWRHSKGVPVSDKEWFVTYCSSFGMHGAYNREIRHLHRKFGFSQHAPAI